MIGDHVNQGHDWLDFDGLVSAGLTEGTARRVLDRFGSTGHGGVRCVEGERLSEYLDLFRTEESRS
jgi:hypothetical protein